MESVFEGASICFALVALLLARLCGLGLLEPSEVDTILLDFLGTPAQAPVSSASFASILISKIPRELYFSGPRSATQCSNIAAHNSALLPHDLFDCQPVEAILPAEDLHPQFKTTLLFARFVRKRRANAGRSKLGRQACAAIRGNPLSEDLECWLDELRANEVVRLELPNPVQQ